MTTATISPKVAAQAESVSLQDIVTRNMKVAMTLRNVKQKDLANALGVELKCSASVAISSALKPIRPEHF